MSFFSRLFNQSENIVQIPLDVRGALFASPMPYGPYDRFNQLIKHYRKRRVNAALMLVTDTEIKTKCRRDLTAAYLKFDIEPLHYPIPDLTAPDRDAIGSMLEDVSNRLNSQRIAVHCNAGVGRTGVVIACIVRRVQNCSGSEALDYVKKYLRINMTSEQLHFVRNFIPDVPLDAAAANTRRVQP